MLKEKNQWCSRLYRHHSGSNHLCIIKAQDLYPLSFPGILLNKECVTSVNCLAILLESALLREDFNLMPPFLEWNLLDPLREGEVVGDPLVQQGAKHFPQEGEAEVEGEINERNYFLSSKLN